ncbi:CobW family GTP-binding protein [Pseudooceanicola spongiae]|uniref:GTP-binding protein n=1 Tax=Pseudooceanicola spongiae TaxID=2613965 RepID=A0A7L9WL51_9RHOB|nr:CobW family GTP-binding protein [Pseudooceanicola spongiae]QOL81121.1 GTP-binding protein [Pseudooceanicola spongiae]
MSGRIPVTVLSGYLGSGKTTILNRALAGDHGVRLAVLVNDFGPVNIDAALIRASGERVVELSNGCVCCSIGDDLGETLSAIAAWEDPPERLILEASGVADPRRIAMAAGHWPGFTLDAVLVAVDAETVQARARDKFVGSLITAQLRSADLLVLTKGDLVGAGHPAQVRDWLGETCAGTGVVRADAGDLPLDLLFGISGHGTAVAPESHVHFSTALWQPEGPVDLDRLRALLEGLPPSVHRAKGGVHDAATGQGVLVQCVGRRVSLTLSPPDITGLVLISTGDAVTLEAVVVGLQAACV